MFKTLFHRLWGIVSVAVKQDKLSAWPLHCKRDVYEPSAFVGKKSCDYAAVEISLGRLKHSFTRRIYIVMKVKKTICFFSCRLVLTSLLLFLSQQIVAQSSDKANSLPIHPKLLKGYVLDVEGESLPGAYVYSVDRQQTAVSDEEGYFELELDHRVDSVRVEFVGFKPHTFFRGSSGEIQIFVLEPDTQLEEVTVTGHGLGILKNRKSIFGTESISAKALTRAACCNLSESFVTNPSVDVNYSDAVTGAKQIQLLGLAGTYVQMLTENFPNQRGAAAVYGLDYIPGPWMQSIQVSKGAASVKNGYESVTGQINVEYKKPKIADPLLINLFASSTGRYEGNLVGAYELNERLSTAVFADYYNEQQTHDKDNDGFLDMPRMQAASVMNRWHYQTPDFVSQSGVKYLFDKRRSGQSGKSLPVCSAYPPYIVNNRVNRIEAFSKNGFILNSEREESLALIVSGSYHDQQSNYAQWRYNVYQSNLYASFLYERELGSSHKMAVGANLNWDKYAQRGNVVNEYTPWWSDVQETVAGAYAEYTWLPTDKFTLLVGVRGDYSTLHKWFATPRLHLKYDIAEWVYLRISAGKGYRTSFVLPENSYLLVSNRIWHVEQGLKQESAWNYGVTASFYIPVGNEELTVNADWYYTDFQNQIVTDLDKDAHAVWFYNLRGKSTSNVLQLEASYPLFRGFTLMGAYRWMNVKTDYADLRLSKPLTGRYKALVTASYETKLRKWQFDFTAQFNGGGRMPTPDKDNPQWESHFPSYILLNAQLARRFKRWSIYTGGENLADFKQKNPIVGASSPYGKDFDATMIWGPTMGRKFYIGIRYNIPKV